MKLRTQVIGFIFMSALAVSMFLYAEIKPYDLLLALLISFKKFVLGLTLLKVLLLGVKRYLIDHVISKNFKEHFFCHLERPLKNWWEKVRFRDRLIFLLPASVVALFGVYLTGINTVLTALGIKAFIIGFFKVVWLLGAKIFYFFTVYIWDSWFTPVLEIFVLSWLLKWIEKVPVIHRLFARIQSVFVRMFKYLGDKIDQLVNFPVQNKLNEFGKWLAKMIDEKNQK